MSSEAQQDERDTSDEAASSAPEAAADIPSEPAAEESPADIPTEPAAEESPADIPTEPAAEESPIAPAEPAAEESADAVTEETADDADVKAAAVQTVSYDYNASLYTTESGETYTGVYSTAALTPNSAGEADAPTIGMPSIADQNLDTPTTEAPAIIQGAAYGYENRLGPVNYETLKERVDPYADFPFKIVEEQGTDGTTHKKLTGFDGTYVITRLDVSKFYTTETAVPQYLHLKLEKNMALIPGMGMTDNNKGFADSLGNKTGAYLLEDLIDKTSNTPYVDVILFSTGKLAAGADAGKQDAFDGDVPVQMYVDDIGDYDPDLKYDPQSTDPDHEKKVLAKFFDAARTTVENISRYLLKGSDLALETMVEDGGETTYWSLKKSMEDSYYDQPIDSSPTDPGSGQTVKLITEVPVTEQLTLQGESEKKLKKRTLDLNSFDIQVANNTTTDTQTYSDGFTLKNAWLTLEDLSNTTGAEMAIGNNAQFIIDQGGKLIIDETCQLEIEWDGATTAAATSGTATATKPDILNNGLLDLRAGGEIVNNGIITIEGSEGKPYQENTKQQVVESQKGFGELTINPGATLTNNGALLVYGKLYNLGNLINKGKFDDLIISYDPDKGQFAYHRGIQVSWKDDVTQQNVQPGALYNGIDRNGQTYPNALLKNRGDIVLVPGTLENYGVLHNMRKGNIYLGTATEAIIPIEPTQAAPTVTTKRITLNPPVASKLVNYGTIKYFGDILPASVAINDNGSFGKLTTPGDHPELFNLDNQGKIVTLKDFASMAFVVSEDDSDDEDDDEDEKEDAEDNLLASVRFEDGGWLYLYKDKTFLMILPDDTRVTGIYDVIDDDLIFVPTDGAVVRPAKDESGNCAYTVNTPSGAPYDFTLTEAFIARVRAAL